MISKWKYLKYFIYVAFHFYGKEIKEIIPHINLKKLKLDEGDKYYCLTRSDYNFWDTTFEERILQRIKIDEEANIK